MAKRPLETFITLVLEDADAELAQAHRELYPERIPEQIPLSLTLLYPWIPAQSVSEADLERLRAFFADCPRLEFQLTSIAAFPGKVVYAVPEPDDELRATMRALWAVYPEYPPYREPGGDVPEREYAVTFEQVTARVEPLLPVSCVVEAATLMEEFELDRCRVRETLPFRRRG